MVCIACGEVARTVTQHVHACMQEFCNGGALRTMLQCGALSARRLPQRFRRVLGLAVGIARGMAFITARGILHGDLNPSNILLQVRAHHCLLFYPLSLLRQAAAAVDCLSLIHI